MTPERTKQLLPIIQAFAEGQQIEYRHHFSNEWRIVTEPSWFDDFEYRIKIELPKYRVFQYRNAKILAVCTSSSKDKDYLKRLEDVENAGNGVWVTDWIECSNIKE